MKFSKMFSLLVLISLFLVPIISTALAAEKPSYVGFNDDQRIIWNTAFDQGPLQNYYEDAGATEELAELLAEAEFDAYGWSEKTKAFKLYIIEIKDEKEVHISGEDYDTLRYIASIYKTKDPSDPEAWKKVEENKRYELLEPDEELYGKMFGLEHGFMFLVIPKNLRYGAVIEEWEDDIDDYNLDDSHDAAVGVVKLQYFLSKKSVGISTEWNDKTTDDTDSFESISKYTDDGILYYYEFTYAGDTIAKIELETLGGTYFIENWWWIAIIAGIAVIVVVVIVVIVIIRKRR